MRQDLPDKQNTRLLLSFPTLELDYIENSRRSGQEFRDETVRNEHTETRLRYSESQK